MLNLFVSAENKYAQWSESGYFASSNRYYDTPYRPDIAEEIWPASSENNAMQT